MEEVYVVVILLGLLYLYLYNSSLSSCSKENNNTYQYFDDMYYNLPKLNTVKAQHSVQENMANVDKTLKYFKKGSEQTFNPQLGRSSDLSVINRLPNGSPAYFNNDVVANTKNRKENNLFNDLKLKWNSRIEKFADDESTARDYNIDSKYTENILQKGDSNFYAITNNPHFSKI